LNESDYSKGNYNIAFFSVAIALSMSALALYFKSPTPIFPIPRPVDIINVVD
jgi:hypothetical protein